jgi:hypothetical protein
LQMSETCIHIRLLQIYFQRITEFRGGGGGEPVNPPPGTPLGRGIRFYQQHIQCVCDAIKPKLLNIATNSNICNLEKLKNYQALNTLGYTNSLFTGLKFLMIRHKGIHKLWPCKWSATVTVKLMWQT